MNTNMNMTTTTKPRIKQPFATWLLRQADRHDPIGDVARDFSGDVQGDPTLREASGGDVLRRVSMNGCSLARTAARDAIAEWRHLRSGVIPARPCWLPQRISYCGDNRVHPGEQLVLLDIGCWVEDDRYCWGLEVDFYQLPLRPTALCWALIYRLCHNWRSIPAAVGGEQYGSSVSKLPPGGNTYFSVRFLDRECCCRAAREIEALLARVSTDAAYMRPDGEDDPAEVMLNQLIEDCRREVLDA